MIKEIDYILHDLVLCRQQAYPNTNFLQIKLEVIRILRILNFKNFYDLRSLIWCSICVSGQKSYSVTPALVSIKWRESVITSWNIIANHFPVCKWIPCVWLWIPWCGPGAAIHFFFVCLIIDFLVEPWQNYTAIYRPTEKKNMDDFKIHSSNLNTWNAPTTTGHSKFRFII